MTSFQPSSKSNGDVWSDQTNLFNLSMNADSAQNNDPSFIITINITSKSESDALRKITEHTFGPLFKFVE